MSESIRAWLLPRLVQLVTPTSHLELNGDLKPAPAQLHPSTPLEDTPYTTGYRVQALAFADSASQSTRRVDAGRENGEAHDGQPDDVWALVSDREHKVPVKLNGKEVRRWESANPSQHLTSLRYCVLALRQLRPSISQLPPVFENRPADAAPSIGLHLEVASFEVVAVDLSPPGEGVAWFRTSPLQNAFLSHDWVASDDETRLHRLRFARWIILQSKEIERRLNRVVKPLPKMALAVTEQSAAPTLQPPPAQVATDDVAGPAPGVAAQKPEAMASLPLTPQKSQQREEVPSQVAKVASHASQAMPRETQGWGDFVLPEESSQGWEYDHREAVSSSPEVGQSQASQGTRKDMAAALEATPKSVEEPHPPTWMRVQAEKGDAFTPTPSEAASPHRSGQTPASTSSSRQAPATCSSNIFPPTLPNQLAAPHENESGNTSVGSTQSQPQPEPQARQPWDARSSGSTRLTAVTAPQRQSMPKARFAGVPLPSSSPPRSSAGRGREVAESESPEKRATASIATAGASDAPSPPFTLSSSSGTSAGGEEAQAGPSTKARLGAGGRNGRARVEEDEAFEEAPSTARDQEVERTEGKRFASESRKASVLVPETQRGQRVGPPLAVTPELRKGQDGEQQKVTAAAATAPASESSSTRKPNAPSNGRQSASSRASPAGQAASSTPTKGKKRSAEAAALNGSSAEPEARAGGDTSGDGGSFKRTKTSKGKARTKVKETDRLKAVQALMAKIVD